MRVAAFILLCVVGVPAVGQVPTSRIASATGTLGEGFSNVVGVAELPDGRVVVADGKDRALWIGDFTGGRLARLGRNGEGPNEYLGVSGLFRTAGDTVRMLDFQARRILFIAPNGALAGNQTYEIPIYTPSDERFAGTKVTGSARYFDASGASYSETSFLERGKGISPEGAFIVKSDPATQTATRLFSFQPWYPEKSTRWRSPFMYGDVWAAAPDGRIARVIPTDYHVEWYRGAELIAKGPPTAYEPVRLVKADRDAWYAARAAQAPASAGVTGPPPAPATSPATDSRSAFVPFTDSDFPQFKPPFVEEFVGRAAIVGPGNELWVTRAGALGQKAVTVDVFDAMARLTRHVELPESTRLAGFGKSSIYLIRTDTDGLQWLERHPR